MINRGNNLFSYINSFYLRNVSFSAKIFQQFFLFVISPFIAAASVADDGKRMKQFQEMYASKSFAILGLVVGVQLYSVFIGRAMNW
ncbi:Uncharacterised protein, partial [Metamycoplasma alkalescens]